MLVEANVSGAIEALINDVCDRVDGGRGAEGAELFAEDAVVETPHFNLSGREEIHSWFSERATPGSRLSRHFWSNLRVTAQGEGQYVARAYTMTVAGNPGAPTSGARISTGTSTDEIVVRDHTYLFAARRLVLAAEGRIVDLEVAA